MLTNLSEYYVVANVDAENCYCDLCGRPIKDVFIVSNGKNKANLGSECVKKIAIAQGKEKPKGIENVPKKKRRKVTLTLKQVRENLDPDDLLPW